MRSRMAEASRWTRATKRRKLFTPAFSKHTRLGYTMSTICAVSGLSLLRLQLLHTITDLELIPSNCVTGGGIELGGMVAIVGLMTGLSGAAFPSLFIVSTRNRLKSCILAP